MEIYAVIIKMMTMIIYRKSLLHLTHVNRISTWEYLWDVY